MTSNRSRILGMLLGAHAGDSLGAPVEFKRPEEIDRPVREMTGGGCLGWKPGEATDDTDLMLCLLESLVERGGFQPEDLARSFITWFETRPVDIGNIVGHAILTMRRRISEGESPVGWGGPGPGSGSLMRCAPLALLPLTSANLRSVCRAQTELTHTDPACVAADFAFVSALKVALAGKSKDAITDQLLKASETDLEIHAAIRFALSDSFDPREHATGHVLHTLASAIYFFSRHASLEEMLIAAVSIGGDADTRGAIVGALAGAHHGLAAIPERWLNLLEHRTKIEQLVAVLVQWHQRP